MLQDAAKWLVPFEEEIGVRVGRYFTVRQVRVIISKLGLPAEEAD